MKGFLVGLLLLIPVLAFAAMEPIPPVSDVQVAVRITQPPSPMVAEDKAYLVYEIYLTNFGHTPQKLLSMSLADQANPENKIANFDTLALNKMIHPVGASPQTTDLTLLPPGAEKIMMVWVPFGNVSQIPNTIQHTLVFQNQNAQLETAMLNVPVVTVQPTPSMTISAPLRGMWVAVNGPSNTSIHRTTYRVGDGKVYFAQRFAIDFVRIGQDGLTYNGDKLKNSSYHAYGADVYAVAPGRVMVARNDIPENIPGDQRAVKMTAETVGGNHVVIEVGYHQYAFYAHMQPGSVRVKPGDIVTQGQMLGKVGNTGNSSEPHLHFHIIDRPTFIYGNGVPYVFDKFSWHPSKFIPGEMIKVQTLGSDDKKLTNQLMLENALISF